MVEVCIFYQPVDKVPSQEIATIDTPNSNVHFPHILTQTSVLLCLGDTCDYHFILPV